MWESWIFKHSRDSVDLYLSSIGDTRCNRIQMLVFFGLAIDHQDEPFRVDHLKKDSKYHTVSPYSLHTV